MSELVLYPPISVARRISASSAPEPSGETGAAGGVSDIEEGRGDPDPLAQLSQVSIVM
jgi:hypothetical protein